MDRSAGQLQNRGARSQPAGLSRPDRISECAGSRNSVADCSNAVLTGRLQQGFVTGVAQFLGLTGGVKLLGVLQEARVLGAADPLFPFLTMRQVLFLAAGLELGVAYTLWRHRTAVWSPWLVLWLAGLFTGYRFSLWFIGFRGHCSCLGHLFDWLPGFNVWADRAMLASLAMMAMGRLWCILTTPASLRWRWSLATKKHLVRRSASYHSR